MDHSAAVEDQQISGLGLDLIPRLLELARAHCVSLAIKVIP